MSVGRIYLAMPVTAFDTAVERKCTHALEAVGWTVVSPNAPEHQAGYQAGGMPYFMNIVAGCDALAFVRFDDGTIGAGVAQEVMTAFVHGKLILRMAEDWEYEGYEAEPCDRYVFEGGWILTIEETRAKIAAIRSERTAA